MKRLIALIAVLCVSFMLSGCWDDKKAPTEADKKATEGKFEKVEEPPVPTFTQKPQNQ